MRGGGPGYGPGYGPGRGYGPGAGMLESLNLSDEQRDKIQAMQEENRQKNWTTMGQLRTEMFALRRMYYADKVDAERGCRAAEESRRAAAPDAEVAPREPQPGRSRADAGAAQAVPPVPSVVDAGERAGVADAAGLNCAADPHFRRPLPETALAEKEALRSQLLGRFPLFSGLPAERLSALLEEAELLRAPAGAVLFDAKQPCRGFPLVLEGSIRVTKRAPNGREILLYRVEPGQSCILSGGCLLGQSDYTASGIAETEVAILSVPPALFNDLMLQFEPFRRYVFGMYGERLSEVMELVEEVAFRQPGWAPRAAARAARARRRGHAPAPRRGTGQRARDRQPAAAQLRAARLGAASSASA